MTQFSIFLDIPLGLNFSKFRDNAIPKKIDGWFLSLIRVLDMYVYVQLYPVYM